VILDGLSDVVQPGIALYVIPAKAGIQGKQAWIPAYAGMTWKRGVGGDSRNLLSQAQAMRVSVMNMEVPTKNNENTVFGIIDAQDAVRGELVEPRTALRQAQGERFRSYFQRNGKGEGPAQIYQGPIFATNDAVSLFALTRPHQQGYLSPPTTSPPGGAVPPTPTLGRCQFINLDGT
jgi:hypothetical protein